MLPHYAGAVSDRRDQLHVLPDAEREARRRLGARRRRRRIKLTLKAPRRITHDSRLKNCGDAGQRRSARSPATLGDKLGALLFQLPPNLKKDLALFDAFLDELPPQGRARRSSSGTRRGSTTRCSAGWRRATSALCVADSEKLSTPVRITARLRVFPAARRGLHARRHRTLGRHDRARDGVVPRRVRLFQARGRREEAPNSRGSLMQPPRPGVTNDRMTEPFVDCEDRAGGTDVACSAGASRTATA